MVDEYSIPDDVKLAESHEYARLLDDDRVRVGITEYAANQLGDIVFVELPEIGQSFEQGESFGSIESVKAQSDLYLPVSGEVIAVNSQLSEEPEMVNDDPYQGGWMIEVAITKPEDLDKLMSPNQYLKFLADSN